MNPAVLELLQVGLDIGAQAVLLDDLHEVREFGQSGVACQSHRGRVRSGKVGVGGRRSQNDSRKSSSSSSFFVHRSSNSAFLARTSSVLPYSRSYLNTLPAARSHSGVVFAQSTSSCGLGASKVKPSCRHRASSGTRTIPSRRVRHGHERSPPRAAIANLHRRFIASANTSPAKPPLAHARPTPNCYSRCHATPEKS